jgi:hypothetical protein
MLVGRKPERFLPACLESIADAVDLLVVNDNSCGSASGNLAALTNSALYRQGKVKIIPSEFKGFGYCKNLCLDYLRANPVPGMWVLNIDCDEVHTPGITALTRRILPNLPSGIGIVDGYFRHFIMSSRYYVSLDRRHNMILSFNNNIHWEGSVHEKLVNTCGARIGLPYRYFHYGYLVSIRELLKRWELYGSLGDAISGGYATQAHVNFNGDACRAMCFRVRHPDFVFQLLEEYRSKNREDVRIFEDLVKEYNPTRREMLRKNFSYDTIMAWRRMQFMGRFSFNTELRHGLTEMLEKGSAKI